MHIWDVSESAKSGTCVRPGMGVMPFIDVLKVLVEIGYDKSLSIEYGAEEKDPFPGTIETMGYMKGLLSTIETPVFVK